MAVRLIETPKHRVLREVYRHYLEFRDLVSLPEHDGQGGYGNSDGVIEYGYSILGDNLVELFGTKDCKDWDQALEKFTKQQLLGTGDVEEVQVLNLDSSLRFAFVDDLDEDGEVVFDGRGFPVLVPVLDDDGAPVPVMKLQPIIKANVRVTLSFWDLQGALKHLSPRKREAVFYNVILDKRQRDVAEIMSITTVSVGQYVEQAMLQLSETYFANLEVVEDESISGASV